MKWQLIYKINTSKNRFFLEVLNEALLKYLFKSYKDKELATKQQNKHLGASKKNDQIWQLRD